MQSKDERPAAWQHRARRVTKIVPSATATPLERARLMRHNPGDAERRFWSRTQNRKLGGYKIRRQAPIGSFIVDFVCVAARLVIEIDGDQHAETVAYDEARTRSLEKMGYRVMRIPTHEVLHDIELVLERVHLALEERVIELGKR
jgi:very-short-patch-repair endonuclease